MAITFRDTDVLAEAAAEGITEKTYRNRWKILAALCLALLTAMIANMSMNLALPALGRDLQLTQLQLTWIVESFALVFAALLFVASAVADRYGRKITMQVGLVIFGAASLYAGFLASSGAELIASRVAMGLGAALIMPTTLSIVNVVFPTSQRAKAIAIWSAVSGVGMMFGSVITGALLQYFSWESAFLLTGVLAVAAIVAAGRLVPESRDHNATPVDWLGGAFATVGLGGIVYTIMEAPSEGIHGLTLITLIAGVIGLVAFLIRSKRIKFPLLDLNLFKSVRFSVSAVSVTLTFFAMVGVFFGMSQIFQLVMGYSVFMSSIAFIPAMLPMMFVGPLVPRIVARIGAKVTVGTGLLLVTGGFIFMTMWPTVPSYWHFLAGMSVVVMGMALTMTPATNMMMAAVPKDRSGMGSATNDTTRELGASLGIAVLGAMISSHFTAGIRDAAAVLPDAAREFATSSLAGALAVADEMGGAGAALADAARTAFMGGFEAAMVVAAIIAGITAVIVFVLLPNDKTTGEHPEPVVDSIDGEALEAELDALTDAELESARKLQDVAEA